MTRFNQVNLNKTTRLVEVGAGLLWDDVYQALDGTGLNVVGGRVSGVGVAGFTLGGGAWASLGRFLVDKLARKKAIRGCRTSMDLLLITSSRSSSYFQTEPSRPSPPKIKISGLASG